jgi:3-oxoacyl-[acyl-carrier-protein] synthase II
LIPTRFRPTGSGVCIGTALGGVSYAEKEHLAYIEHGPKAVSPLLALSIFAGAGSCNIAIEYGFTGPATANGDSCASSPVALGNALNYLRRGEADVMIAVGRKRRFPARVRRFRSDPGDELPQ